MLEKIVIKNVNSIGECIIDFHKGNYGFLNENIKEKFLSPIALYGHNGSGKSSVFKAMDQLIRLVIEPPERLFPFIVNNFEYDAFSDEYRKNPNEAIKNSLDKITGEITIFFGKDGHEYEYSVATTSFKNIRKEYLKKNGEYIFDRNERTYNYRKKENTLPMGESQLILLLRKLSALELNDNDIRTTYSFLCSFAIINSLNINSTIGFITSAHFNSINAFDLLITKSDEVREIFKKYKDFPLYRVARKANAVQNVVSPVSNYYIEFDSENGEPKKLPLSFISAGMFSQSLMLSTILSLPENSVVFADEIEVALHPSTIKNFLDFVRTKKIQLVFSSHNTNILQQLRPDQIYFAHWKDGYSKYSRLSKIYPNIREINNIEKMYLGSVFDEAIKKDE